MCSRKAIPRSSTLSNLNPFLDPKYILREFGRAKGSESLSYDEKHPIILPYSRNMAHSSIHEQYFVAWREPANDPAHPIQVLGTEVKKLVESHNKLLSGLQNPQEKTPIPTHGSPLRRMIHLFTSVYTHWR